MENEQILSLIEYLTDYADCKNPDQLNYVIKKTIQTLNESISFENDMVQDDDH